MPCKPALVFTPMSLTGKGAVFFTSNGLESCEISNAILRASFRVYEYLH